MTGTDTEYHFYKYDLSGTMENPVEGQRKRENMCLREAQAISVQEAVCALQRTVTDRAHNVLRNTFRRCHLVMKDYSDVPLYLIN